MAVSASFATTARGADDLRYRHDGVCAARLKDKREDRVGKCLYRGDEKQARQVGAESHMFDISHTYFFRMPREYLIHFISIVATIKLI